ncbi:hypothetical protein KVV02_000407 [Mortierella alpina]|uniref:Uncharacterized protein n=1 Tax=Mortierella alpina TaxID=64518 RepID=A0A9P8D2T9_MORAP|nr:hypothetical protein KVV02_000407 [Mortierella alpina]
MNIQVNTLDLHVAIVPSVAVEFTTIIDSEDMDSPTSPSYDGPNTTGVEHAEEPSPMDNEEFAYPTNLTSEVLDYEDEEGEQTAPGSSTNQSTSTAGISGSKMFSWDEINDDNMARGHFRANNPSTGSDLIQVTVEDLLISEEQDRTIKASMDQCRQEQEHHPPTLAPSLSTSNNATKNSVTTTTITATIRSNGKNKKAISFDNMDRLPAATEQPEPQKQPVTSAQSQQTNIKESRLLQPPAPRVLTPAQQREADADANIQKAIELHENNQLEEATHHFWLAAQSENPLGQLMYGLSLRHGWGCKPNPTEALLFLQRAAEYAMGELNELGPVQPRISPSTATTAAAPSSSIDRAQKQDQQQISHQKSNSNPTQQTLRRMGSMDRTAAMITARKELVMALYELGMSYLKGWGVTKDKSVAFTYFKIAADLGDPDSQNETAMCYYEGIGTDKDMYQSAKYYRMAAAQGASQLGNSWIWKPKYDMYCAAENAAALAVGAGSATAARDPIFHANNNNNNYYYYYYHYYFICKVLCGRLEDADIQHVVTFVQGFDRILSDIPLAPDRVFHARIFHNRGETRNRVDGDS